MSPAKISTNQKTSLLIVVLCVATRLPQLLSPNLVLDGDECVMAFMAKNIYLGRHLDIFFLGQQYGFSLVESLFIIPFYAILGIGTLAVKLAMLTLWTAAVLFFFHTLVNLNPGRRGLALLATLLFISAPAWAAWSMKARGGYLTAFFLSSLFLYLLFHPRFQARSYVYLLLGCVAVVIFQSQALWLPGLAPFICYVFLRNKSIKAVLLFGAGILPTVLLFWFLKKDLHSFYTPHWELPSFTNVKSYIARLPLFVYDNMHGNYFLNTVQKPDFFAAFCGSAYTTLVFALPVAAVLIWVFRSKESGLFIAATSGVLFTLSYTLLSPVIEPRYLLPLLTYTLLGWYLLLQSLGKSKIFVGGILTFSAFSTVATAAFYNFSFDNVHEKELRAALSTIEADEINYLFTRNDMFAWQIIFYSDEKILCRGPEMPGRYPPYSTQVNDAFENHLKTALIGDNDHTDDYKPLYKDVIVTGHYYLCLYPPREILNETFSFTTKAGYH